MIIGVIILSLAGVLPGSLSDGTSSEATVLTVVPATAIKVAGDVIPVATEVPANQYVAPDLPIAVDLTTTDVPWSSGDTVVVGEDGANLRPYPVSDDDLAAASTGLAAGTELQIISTFRLQMADGYWWYVRLPSPDDDAPPTFGWVRQDLIEPSTDASGG